MSDRVGLKAKDNAAKKFSSLNLNQTYKGTKVEPKASTGEYALYRCFLPELQLVFKTLIFENNLG